MAWAPRPAPTGPQELQPIAMPGQGHKRIEQTDDAPTVTSEHRPFRRLARPRQHSSRATGHRGCKQGNFCAQPMVAARWSPAGPPRPGTGTQCNPSLQCGCNAIRRAGFVTAPSGTFLAARELRQILLREFGSLSASPPLSLLRCPVRARPASPPCPVVAATPSPQHGAGKRG